MPRTSTSSKSRSQKAAKIVRPKSSSRNALRLHGAIARDIGTKIASGKYKPGSLLTGEILASDKLKVSRTAYREAVRILAAKGLVESRPKVGTRVNPVDQWHLLDPDVLAWIFEFKPENAMLTNIFELRKIIEPSVAALAAERRSKQHLMEMATALEGMAMHGFTTEEGRHADQQFHSALLRASGNAFLASLTTSISAAITWTTVFKLRRNALVRDSVSDHRRVYEAVAAGNARAAAKAMEHLIEHALDESINVNRK
ncbi:MAG TPA: FadR/GntR family transcriptional regulator [Steroidobacteraceae bacterium]|jgi:DNA-binding FadR family transcriptional regulator|nr:FadR/GntR family transcriptional regulator [Steroidobacteraceae bacterium]